MQPVSYDAKQSLTRNATDAEVHQHDLFHNPVLGSLGKQDLISVTASPKYNSTFGNALVRGLRECNHVLEYTFSTAEPGICFSRDCSWNDAVVATVSDASFGQETEDRQIHVTLQMSTSIHDRTGSR